MKFNADSTAEQVTEGRDLTGQTWLITGANSGLGHETARVLALRGAHIIAAARTEAKARDALTTLGIDGTPVACDLADLSSVREAVATVLALDTKLDGIIANAGIMALPELHQQQGIELQFFTNHVGHFALVTGLMDRLTSKGRVVMLSSGAHFMAKQGLELDNLSGERDYDAWRMYGRSKLANILFARALATRFTAAGSKRTANAVHPGVIRTNLGRHLPNAKAIYDSMASSIKTTEQGAATQCYVATHPRLNAITGVYFSDCKKARTLDAATDDALAEALWDKTLELIAS
jgi:WW domain-containing oxidoreductase